MISPSPAQSPVDQRGPQLEAERRNASLPPPVPERRGAKRRGSVIKAILRPILKALYYIIRWIRAHRIAALIAILLLLASIFATSYFVTGNAPIASNSNSVRDSIRNNPQLSDDVKAWLLALRDGNLDTMISVEKSINQSTRPPDTALYLLQFSEPRAQVKWTNVTLSSIKTAPDGLVDSYVEVDMTPSPTVQAQGGTRTVVLWHFATDPAGRIYLLDYVTSRTS